MRHFLLPLRMSEKQRSSFGRSPKPLFSYQPWLTEGEHLKIREILRYAGLEDEKELPSEASELALIRVNFLRERVDTLITGLEMDPQEARQAAEKQFEEAERLSRGILPIEDSQAQSLL